MNHIPATLVFIGTSGSAGNQERITSEEVDARIAAGENIIKVQADARTEAYELKHLLTNSGAWPENLPKTDIEAAISNYIEQNQLQGKCPFPNLVPDSDEPEDMYVRQHPTIPDMWLVIDSDQGTIYSSWETEQQALCAAWEGQEGAETCLVYFSLEVEAPEGYSVTFTKENDWSWVHAIGTTYANKFATKTGASIGAWKHKINATTQNSTQTITPPGIATSYADLHEGLSKMVESGRLTEQDIPDDYQWLVESLAFLASRPDPKATLDHIHSLMDGTEWDSDTLDHVSMSLLQAGYTIQDVIEE